jgi:EAL domain-containing protein (putative c-di-GMP-specific phosphodiesterase class I)
VSLTLDDFGADSSLGRLQRLQVHGLKIDGSLVHDMVVDQAQLRILQAIIDVAHGLGIKVCAEAVETEEQRQLLLELGCDALQGFLLGQPRPEPIPSRARSPAAA